MATHSQLELRSIPGIPRLLCGQGITGKPNYQKAGRLTGTAALAQAQLPWHRHLPALRQHLESFSSCWKGRTTHWGERSSLKKSTVFLHSPSKNIFPISRPHHFVFSGQEASFCKRLWAEKQVRAGLDFTALSPWLGLNHGFKEVRF